MDNKTISAVAVEARFQEIVKQRDLAQADCAFKAGRIAELEAMLKEATKPVEPP